MLSTMGTELDDKPVEASTFEGMFQRALHPSEALVADLRAVGFDLKRIEPRYTTQVWHDSLDVARKHVFPGLGPQEGYRALGQLFIEGFFKTIIGKLIAAPLPLVGPSPAIKRLAQVWKAGRKDMEVNPVQESERRWRIYFRDRHPLPEFVVGILEGGGKYTGATLTVTVDARTEAGFEILIVW
jgi:uncharacterized protein (TIGR02265 family)